MSLSLLIGPIVGGIIGYITNSIAIKMLFRPLKPVYIGGKKLPFTPGMIPKEQARLAKTVGEIVEQELIDPELLKQYLLSQEMYLKIENAVVAWFKDKKSSNITVQEYLNDLTSEKAVMTLREVLEDKMNTQINTKLKESHLADPIVNQLEKTIKENIGPFSMFVGDAFIEGIKSKAKEMIEELIQDQGGEMIEDLVSDNIDEFLQSPISTVATALEPEINKINYVLLKHYKNIVETQLTEMLKVIRVGTIVEQKIKTYDPFKMEEIILSVVKKELNAIVWLGAVLGMILGFVVNLF